MLSLWDGKIKWCISMCEKCLSCSATIARAGGEGARPLPQKSAGCSLPNPRHKWPWKGAPLESRQWIYNNDIFYYIYYSCLFFINRMKSSRLSLNSSNLTRLLWRKSSTDFWELSTVRAFFRFILLYFNLLFTEVYVLWWKVTPIDLWYCCCRWGKFVCCTSHSRGPAHCFTQYWLSQMWYEIYH